MGEIIPFRYKRADSDFEIRLIDRAGEPWFVLNDVCQVLGIDNSRMAARRLRDCEKGVTQIDTPGGLQEVAIVSEQGLYRLVMRSDKPEAREFQDWVVGEVLPSIRKTGGYGGTTTDRLLERITVAVEGQTAAVRCLVTDLGTVKTDVVFVKDEQKAQGIRLKAVEQAVRENLVKRKRFSADVERKHATCIAVVFHRRCPACNDRQVVTQDGVRLPNGERDHYRAVNRPDEWHTWIICRECHEERHGGPLDRFDPAFNNYQDKLRRFLGITPDLFRVVA